MFTQTLNLLPDVPFFPQPMRVLRKRYPRALWHAFDEMRIARGEESPPAKFVDQVFDFGSGVRLFVCRARMLNGSTGIHVMVVVNGDQPSVDRWVKGKSFEQVFNDIRLAGSSRYRLLSGDLRYMHFQGVNIQGYPHWRIPDSQ